MIGYDRLWLGGKYSDPHSTQTLDVHSPYSFELVGRVPLADRADVDVAVEAAQQAVASGALSDAGTAERSRILAAAADLFEAHTDEIAQILGLEVGLPVHSDARRQVSNAVMISRYMAEAVLAYPFEQERTGARHPVQVRQVPVGVVAAIAPWNTPFFTSMGKIAAAVAAGCPVVLKPSPETPLHAFLLAELLAEAGLPEGCLSVVPADREVSEYLVSHGGVDKISFTGSTATGRKIAAICGRDLRRVTLELGGKSAAILLDDFEMTDLVARLAPMTTMNNGQTCINQTRVLAPRGRYQEVVDALTTAYRDFRLGDPLAESTELGPLISAVQRERVEGYIESGREQGARVTVGGSRPGELATGWFVRPTVFADVTPDMRVAQEEIFGPVVCVMAYDDEQSALGIANGTPYGLSGSVWTADPERGAAVARRMRTGTVAVNGLEGDVGAPFGGFKQSGIGREFGPEGIGAFCEYQSLAIL
jgi:aldehyde dehydrogenase (NAD+)